MRSKNDMRVMQHIWLCALITCKDWFCYRWRVLPNRCFQYHPLLTGACWLEQTSLTRMWPIKMKQNERSLDFVKAGVRSEMAQYHYIEPQFQAHERPMVLSMGGSRSCKGTTLEVVDCILHPKRGGSFLPCKQAESLSLLNPVDHV